MAESKDHVLDEMPFANLAQANGCVMLCLMSFHFGVDLKMAGAAASVEVCEKQTVLWKRSVGVPRSA